MIYKLSIFVENSLGNEVSARYLNTLKLGWSVLCPRPVEKEWWTKNMGGSDCCSHREAAEVCPMAVSKLKWTIPTCLFSRLWNCWILLLIPWTFKTWALFPHWLYCTKNYFLKWSIPQTLGQFASFCCLRVSKHRILVWWSFLKELLTSPVCTF